MYPHLKSREKIAPLNARWIISQVCWDDLIVRSFGDLWESTFPERGKVDHVKASKLLNRQERSEGISDYVHKPYQIPVLQSASLTIKNGSKRSAIVVFSISCRNVIWISARAENAICADHWPENFWEMEISKKNVNEFVLHSFDWWWDGGDVTVCTTEDLYPPQCLVIVLKTPFLSQ